MNTARRMSTEHTKELLRQYYQIVTGDIPEQRDKSVWKPENQLGFLLGIVEFGREIHLEELHRLLTHNQFEEQKNYFIESMFDCYIRPFHQSYNTESESCHTPSHISTPSRSDSADDLDYFQEMKHIDLKEALVKRDGVCLFCWNRKPLEASHIIAQKNIQVAYDEFSLLGQAGLMQKHQVQNGLLLCKNCHDEFDKLKLYVDIVDGQMVVKVVNETNDTTSDKHRQWKETVEDLEASRKIKEKRWADGRVAFECNGEMALYFKQKNPTLLPNKIALEFHKTACLIWRMAGGAEPDEEYCSDDDLGSVDTVALKRRFKIQDSVETLRQVT